MNINCSDLLLDSSTSESPAKKSSRKAHEKKRWTKEENNIFLAAFREYIDDKKMPTGSFIRNIARNALVGRHPLSIRVRLHSVINDKLKL